MCLQQLKDHLRTLEELRGQVVSVEVHQFDSRVEEMRRQLQQALLSYGISTPVGVTSAGATGREAGRQRPAVEDNGSEDMSELCSVPLNL